MSPSLGVVGQRTGTCYCIASVGLVIGAPMSGILLDTTGMFLGTRLFAAATVLVASICLAISRLAKTGRNHEYKFCSNLFSLTNFAFVLFLLPASTSTIEDNASVLHLHARLHTSRLFRDPSRQNPFNCSQTAFRQPIHIDSRTGEAPLLRCEPQAYHKQNDTTAYNRDVVHVLLSVTGITVGKQ
jgi:hypothetical protein